VSDSTVWLSLSRFNSFDSSCQIPIVDDELRKAAGEEDKEEEATMQSGSVQRMVTADGKLHPLHSPNIGQ